MTCARRPAGARTPAPSTSAGSGRPDARTGRARARRLSLLPVIALLLGALGLFAAAPAAAQLVSNTGQTAGAGSWTLTRVQAQAFTTGSNANGYTLQSIGVVMRTTANASNTATDFGRMKAELWSDNSGDAGTKLADLTKPASFPGSSTPGTVTFTAPAGTTLAASTTYHVVFYASPASNSALRLHSTTSDDEDTGGAAGWSIANSGRQILGATSVSGTWTTRATSLRIRVNGAVAASTTNANLSALTATTSTSSTGTFTSLTLTPSTFAATTTSYTAQVGNARTHLKLTPTVAATGATVKVGKGTSLTTVTSGSASAAIPLTVGANAITVEVTAADNTTKKTYTVTVTRHAASTVWHATLTPKNLGSTLGCEVSLVPENRCSNTATLSEDEFSVDGADYTVRSIQVASAGILFGLNGQANTALKALKLCIENRAFSLSGLDSSSSPTTTITANPALSWTAGTPVQLSIGSSCPQQTTTPTPTQSTDATLSGLTATQATSASGPFTALSIGTFNSGTTGYAASVANSITHVKLTPAVTDSNATVKVGVGTSLTTVASGSASGAIPLSVGANALKVEVTAQDGTTTRTYTLTVTRAQAQTQAPAPVVPTGRGETVWSATLTAQNVVPSVVVGCTGSGSSSCALTSVLTDDDFSLFGKTFTITQIQQTSAGALDIGFDQAISTQTARRLTLHVGDREFPLSEAAYSSGNTAATWTSSGLSWSASQQVPLRLTLGPRWSGVAYEGGGLLPGPSGGQELLVAEDGSATFGVRLTHAPTANVTVRLYKFAPAAIHGNANAVTFSPKELTFTPTNYGTAQTVTVTGVPDGNARHEHLYIMAASSSADANYALQDGHEALFVTVTDGAGAVKVGLSRGAARESGDGTATNAPVTVWLNRASTSQVRVTYATAPDPDAPSDKRATAGQDYTHVSGTLVFSAGQTRKTVQVPILDDQTEDSGESFRFVLSNLQGATLEEGYGHATIVILNDEAQIDGLSVEGAPGAGGPWAKLDIGAFAPETAAYAVTVPHGTTHARVTPETGDEDLLLWAGSGTGLASVRSGQAGSTVALAVGENVLLVQTRAATGKRQTYRVTVTRQARPGVAVSLSATPNPVGEGSAVTVRATLAAALDEAVTVPLTVTRGTSEDGDHGSLASITLPAGFTSATGTVPTVEDGDGDDERFTVALGSLPSGLTAGTASSVRVTITDNGQQAPDPLTAWLRSAVSEHDGETPFMVELELSESLDSGSRWPSAASFKVKGGSVESVRRFRPYRFHVHVKPKSWKDVTVTLAGGRACDEAGAICTPDGRSVSNTSTMTVGGPVRIRVEGARAKEGKDASLDFAVTLNRAAAHTVSVDYATEDDTATAGSDYTATSGTLTFAAGETAKTVSVPVLDDAVDEGKEVMRLLLSNPKGAYLRNVHKRAKGVIVNDDALQQAWLSRFGRTVGGHVTDAVSGRLEGLTPGAHATLAGQSVDLMRTGDGKALAETLTGLAQRFGAQAPANDDDPFARNGPGGGPSSPASGLSPPTLGAASSPAQTVTGRELLLGSAFHLAGAGDGSGPGLAAWGRAAHGRFDGVADSDTGEMRLDGEVLTGTLGADADWGRLLAGVAVSLSEGEGTFDDPGVDKGSVESTMTTVSPYARFNVSERVSAWGLAGWGTGAMTIVQDARAATETQAARPRQVTKTDLSMRLGALGARGELLRQDDAGGMDLALKADAFFVTTESERTQGSAATSADASRLRLVLEGGRSFVLGGGATVRPALELGVRHDGGDAETGAGVELGGGVTYADPSSGLSLEAKARMLVAHADSDYEEWGVSATARLDPGERGRGLSFSLAPTIGATSSASERLWGARDARALAPGAEFDAARGLRGEMGYGMALFGDRFTGTPNLGFGMSDGGARDYRIGWRLTSAVEGDPGFEVNLDAIRREAANDNAVEHGVMLRSLIRW